MTQDLVKLANQSPLVRNLLRVDDWKGNIVKITPHSVHRFLGYNEKGEPMFQARFHTGRRDGRTNSLINLIYEDTFAFLGKKYGIQSYTPAKEYSFHLAPQEFLASDSFNPDAHAESTSVDGWTRLNGTVDLVWDSIHDNAGNYASDDGVTLVIATQCSATTDQFKNMSRAIVLYDTSSLGAGAVVSSSDYKVYGNSALSQLGGNIDLVSSNPSSSTALASTDHVYTNFGTTLLATSIAAGSINTSGYNTYALNASGIANIDVSGVSKFGMRTSWDTSDTAPTWASGQGDTVSFLAADNGSNEPTLDVTYTSGNITNKFATLLGVG